MNVCSVCSAAFRPKRHTTGLYCSRRCAWLARGGAEFNARIARESASKRGDTQRDRGEGKTYRKRGGRHEHRGIAETMLGRELAAGEIVHHKDGDRRNNDPSNLAIMSQGEHMTHHGLGVKGKQLTWKPWEKSSRFKGGRQ